MTVSTRHAFVLAVCLAAVPAVTHAHFKLVEPASWILEDDRGDPQKGFPCGGSNTDYGKPSYAVTQAVGGSKLHLKVQETIYHPGHYRVALAVWRGFVFINLQEDAAGAAQASFDPASGNLGN